ncbi:MAG TPA: AraC family transcriptional regulator [Tahibacter sp.]|uniref:AraC family transcriptional regulator n=1 Tax=Tahibacter sp. TaxID=2056211 RepID=UPI002CA65637|nr:AraC family transcriptional regulator [Tahibacter sp.]HSX60162.1 AraC family transcriptional regulator [Tahibacter sp.]
MAATHNAIDDPRFSAAVLPTNILSGLVQIAQERGVDASAWFAGFALSPNDICDPSARVSYRQAVAIIRRAIGAMADPALGLLIGRHQDIGNFGLLGLAMKTARSFGDAIALGITYQRATGTLLDLEVQTFAAGEIALFARAPVDDPVVLPFLCEEMFSSVLAVGRELAGVALKPLRLELAYAEPAHVEEYRALFRCELRFGSTHNCLVVDAQTLDHPFPNYNPVTARQALAALLRELEAMPAARSETVAAVERQLRQRIAQNPRLLDVAVSLYRSERTLRRQLAGEGESFTTIHDRVRCERAIELLRDRRLTVAEVGTQVGFGDVREFRRAFKRWTGRTPTELREA